MQNISRLMLLATIAIAVTVLDTPRARAADSCQPVFDALKLVATPSHSYTTSTPVSGGKARTAETVMTQGKKYIRVNGKWMDSHVTTAEVLEQEKANEKKGKSGCQFLRSEPVNGEGASLYHMQREIQGFKEDSEIWVSKATGLPLRAEQDIDMGGEIGKEHRSARFESPDQHTKRGNHEPSDNFAFAYMSRSDRDRTNVLNAPRTGDLWSGF